MKIKKCTNVFVSGAFNIIHPGHIRLLQFAKDLGQTLTVGVISDRLGGSAVHVPEDLRLAGVLTNSLVDHAFIIRDSINQRILESKPDMVVKGKEHEGKTNIEAVALNEYGGELVFCSGSALFTSIDLIRAEFASVRSQTIHFPAEFMERRNITRLDLIELIRKFDGKGVCVIGDLIIDEYISCEPLGMSAEDPTIVVTPIETVRFVGGAGVVAGHTSGLGASTYLITAASHDEPNEFATRYFQNVGVKFIDIIDHSRPTTRKQRFRSGGKTLLRVNHLTQVPVSIETQARMLDAVRSVIGRVQLLIFSDFNYGCLPQSLVDKISGLCNDNGVLMCSDSQSSSQIGNVSRFLGMDLITPTEREARISLQDADCGLVVLAESIRKKSNAMCVFLKLGADGLLIQNSVEDSADGETEQLESLNPDPRDVAGAGDSLLAASALSLVSGGTVWEAALLGSVAAAIQINRVGNPPLSSADLKELIL